MATTAKKSAPAKKTAKKSAAKKSATKKSAPATKKAATKSTSASTSESSSRQSRGKTTAAEIARAGARQLMELTGAEPEGVTGLERTDDGWRVYVEVVELRRIPNSTDLLGLYAVEVDSDGDLTGYQRVRRYVRGKPDEE